MLKDRLERLLKAVRAVVHDSTEAPKAIAAAAGCGYSYLLRAADEAQEEVVLQTRYVGPLTKASKKDDLINFLAEDCGGVFVRLDVGESLDAQTGKTLKEVGEFFTKLAEGAPNGYTHAEVDAVEREWRDAISAGLAQVRKLRAEAK